MASQKLELPGESRANGMALMLHHLALAAGCFEIMPDEMTRENVIKALALQMGDHIYFPAATAFVNSLFDAYDAIRKEVEGDAETSEGGDTRPR